MKLPHIGPSNTIYQDKYQQIRQVKADFGDYTKEYFVRDSGERAGVVVVQNGLVLMVRQYRLLINGLSWEIPGGAVDEGESPIAAAIRECLEETGVRCLNPTHLVFYHASLDISYNPTHLFYCEEVAQERDPGSVHQQEVSGSEWVPLPKCLEMIGENQIQDSFTILGLLAYRILVPGL